jgi:protein-S-isoprenylcysteine O-methyltransferase Ste14
MLIKERLARDGEFLFRWRSYLPLLLLPLFAAAMSEGVRVEQALGGFWSAVWTFFCVAVAVFGFVIRVATIGFVPFGTSGRNTREQRADCLNTTGLYSLVRNPLYLGNFVGLIGFAAATRVWWVVLITGLAYWLYIERIVAAEEAFLERKYGAEYVAWASKTRPFIPRLRNWRPPAMPFSFRTVLRREYNGLAVLGVAFPSLWAVRDIAVEGTPVLVWLQRDAALIGLFFGSLTAFLALRSLKRHSQLLHEPGR